MDQAVEVVQLALAVVQHRAHVPGFKALLAGHDFVAVMNAVDQLVVAALDLRQHVGVVRVVRLKNRNAVLLRLYLDRRWRHR